MNEEGRQIAFGVILCLLAYTLQEENFELTAMLIPPKTPMCRRPSRHEGDTIKSYTTSRLFIDGTSEAKLNQRTGT